MTSRTFKTRFNEHEAAIRLNHPEKSHFAKHVIDYNHCKQISLNELNVLDCTTDYKIRNFKESYHIRSRKLKGNCVNVDEGPLSNSKLLDFTVNIMADNN